MLKLRGGGGSSTSTISATAPGRDDMITMQSDKKMASEIECVMNMLRPTLI